MSKVYIGPYGGLVGFRCPSQESLAPERAAASRSTMGGHLKVKRAARARRSWQVSMNVARPQEFAALAALAEYGTPPWWFVGAWAQVTNVLTPAQSMLVDGVLAPVDARVTPAGVATCADGLVVPRSIAITGDTFSQTRVGRYVPVAPGVPVTASVYLRARDASGARMRIVWVDALGGDMAPHVMGDLFGDAVNLTRRHVTATPPIGAAGVSIRVEGALQVAAPAVTWTDTLLPWHTGHGASQVVASIPTEDPILATADPRDAGRLAAMSMTVQEL